MAEMIEGISVVQLRVLSELAQYQVDRPCTGSKCVFVRGFKAAVRRLNHAVKEHVQTADDIFKMEYYLLFHVLLQKVFEVGIGKNAVSAVDNTVPLDNIIAAAADAAVKLLDEAVSLTDTHTAAQILVALVEQNDKLRYFVYGSLVKRLSVAAGQHRTDKPRDIFNGITVTL